MHVVVSVVPFLSTTFEVNVYVPAVVGVPEMTPVVVFSVNPGGSEPDVIENVNGAVPPFTCNVDEYGAPTVAWPWPQDPHSRSIGGATTTIVQVAVSDPAVTVFHR